MICGECLSEFKAERATAKFCSAKCKMRNKRNRIVTLSPVTVTKPVTLSSDSVTLTETVKPAPIDDSIPVGEPQWPRSKWVKGAWHGMFCRCAEPWCPNAHQRGCDCDRCTKKGAFAIK